MNIYYLDASAWVKRYYQERGTEWIQTLFVEGSLLACAGLGVVEVLATLSRKHKAKQINQSQFQHKRVELVTDWAQFIQIQLSNEVMQEALKLTADYALRGADAIHLASSVVLQKNLLNNNEVIFIASDNELLTAAHNVGMSIHNPI